MLEAKILSRIILRSDGSVPIVFRDTRSVYATAENIAELFSDPMEFIENKSLQYKDSTFEINRKRVALEDVLGLTLAWISPRPLPSSLSSITTVEDCPRYSTRDRPKPICMALSLRR